MIGFYQIATKVENVYDFRLPPEIQSILNTLKFGISLGIEGIPLECLGTQGYQAQLVFWMVVPPTAVVLVVLFMAMALKYHHKELTWLSLTLASLPFVLQICFLAYPVVCGVAFQAFSCYEFIDAPANAKLFPERRRHLRGDVLTANLVKR